MKRALDGLFFVVLLVVSGYVSVQNGEAVCEGLDDLSSFIVSAQRSNLSESVVFSKEELSDTRESSKLLSQNLAYTPGASGEEAAGATANSPDAFAHGSLSSGSSTASTISPRSSSILEVLSDSKKELGIKDIASHLPEYSEKMIQRELADLVEAGHVLKNGLKRWSRYTIALRIKK